MMSNGFARVKLADLLKKSSFELEVHGGDPVSNELRINPDEIRRGRRGFFACFACMFEGKVTPKLELEVNKKFSDAEKQMVGVLPDLCLVTLPDLQQHSLLRQSLAYEAYKIPNMTNIEVHNALFAKTFLYLFNISTVKGLWIEFFQTNILPYVKDYKILILAPIFKKMMQKIYLMLSDKDFHFSKDFQTRDYHGNTNIQIKRLKLCRKYFKEVFAMVLKEVQIQDKALNISRKYNRKFSWWIFLTDSNRA